MMIKFRNIIYSFVIISLLISFPTSARITPVQDYNYERFLIRKEDPNTVSNCPSGYYETPKIPRHMTCSKKIKVNTINSSKINDESLTCWLKSSCSCSGIYKEVNGVCKKK